MKKIIGEHGSEKTQALLTLANEKPNTLVLCADDYEAEKLLILANCKGLPNIEVMTVQDYLATDSKDFYETIVVDNMSEVAEALLEHTIAAYTESV